MSSAPVQNDELKMLLVKMLKHVEKMREDNSETMSKVSELEKRIALIERGSAQMSKNNNASIFSERKVDGAGNSSQFHTPEDNNTRFRDFLESDDLKAFLGGSYDWYVQRWSKSWEKVQLKAKIGSTYDDLFDRTCSVATFNPGAVLAFIPWLYYRKMLPYAIAATVTISIPETFQILTGSAVLDKLPIFMGMAALGLGTLGNGLYRKQARKQIDRARKAIGDNQSRSNYLNTIGGKSIPICIAGIFAVALPSIIKETIDSSGATFSTSSSSAEVALNKIDSITEASPKRDIAQAMITCGGMWANAPIGQQMSMLFIDRNGIITKFGVSSKQIDTWYADGRELQAKIQSAQNATQNQPPDRQMTIGMLALSSGVKCMRIAPIYGNILLGK